MIRISRLSRQWPEFTLRGIDLAIEKGEYFVILGPSGAGKTLLLELLAGIHRAEAGRIDLEGEDITDLPPEQRKIGMVYQDYALFPHLTVAKNIGYGLRYLKVPKEQRAIRVKEVARLVGVDHLLHRHPSTLSGGERQRVALARALVLRPKVLLLDEPLSALDHNTAKRLREYLKQLHKKVGITMIHVTHHRAEAKELADRIAVLRDGTIEAVGTVEEIFLFPPTRFVAEFVGADNLAGGTLTRIDAIPSAKGAARWEGVVAVEGLSLAFCSSRSDIGAMTVGAPVSVMVHPRDLFPTREVPKGHQSNVIKGKVTGLVDKVTKVSVSVECPLPVTLSLTPAQMRQLELTLGSELLLLLAPEDVHLMPG